MKYLQRQIEALIFAATTPVSQDQILEVLKNAVEAEIKEEEVLQCISALIERYSSDDYAFELVEISGGYRFMTKPAHHQILASFLQMENQKKLSRSALETLAIIAYKQPITKAEMERVRGVNCDYTVAKLLEKEFISIVGRSDLVGRPLLYGTSDRFLDYFGLNSIADLPKIKDFEELKNSIGIQKDILEEAKTANQN